MAGGFGNVAHGQSEYGHAKSDVEPRFEGSSPSDGAGGVSIYDTVVKYTVYGFSSRVQIDNSFLVEVSEDGGVNYSPAYQEGAFVSPYNGANSEIDAYQSDPKTLVVRLHKTSLWASGQDIYVRTTGVDEYGQEATKATLVTWDN